MPEHNVERVVPDGSIYFLFELDGFTRHVYENESLEPIGDFTKTWISGAQNEYISISAHENSEMFVMQFLPGGASRLIKGDLSRFANQVVAAEQLLGESVFQLHQSLLIAETKEQKYEAAERFLIANVRPPDSIDVVVSNLVSAIQENSTTRLKDLIAASGYSQKQLIHHFKQRVGLVPKAFQRIVRFNEILPKIMEKQSVSWPKISIECDYFDQSHFIKEFKKFSGYSPKEFLSSQQDHAAANFFPLDEPSVKPSKG